MGVITLRRVKITHEDLAVALARDDYVAGKLDVEQFERAVAAIFDGTDRRYTSPFEPFAVGPDPGKRTMSLPTTGD